MDEPFNSSDVELPPPPPPRQRYHIPSIDKIQQKAEETRLTSKAALKSLEYGFGAPSTRYAQDLWVTRFNTFREFTLHKSLEKPFTGDDVIRFLDAQIGLMKRTDGRPPSAANVDKALLVITQYGNFEYAPETGYKLTPHDFARLKSWKDRAIEQERLTRGRFNRIVYLTLTIASRMVGAWLEHHLKNGALSWNRVISRYWSIVLTVSTACRAGDLARSHLYKGLEYARWEHLAIVLSPEGDTFFHLQATLTIVYEKFSKHTLNEDRPIYFTPLRSERHQHMCLISGAFTQALRHGMVAGGSTVEEVVAYTAKLPDRKVEWLYPKRPLIPSCGTGFKAALLMDQPAGISQLLDTTKMMGLMANMLTRVRTHNFRHGAAKELTNISCVAETGVGHHTRHTLDHAPVTELRGTTEGYGGAPEVDYFSVRVAREFQQKNGPRFSEDDALAHVNKRVGIADCQRWLDQQPTGGNLYDPNLSHKEYRSLTSRARTAIRKERHAEFIATAKPTMKAKSTSEINVLSGLCAKQRRATEQTAKSSLEDMEIPPRLYDTSSKNNEAMATAPESCQGSDMAGIMPGARHDDIDVFIDPRLQGDDWFDVEDLQDEEVPVAQLEQLEQQLHSSCGERLTDAEVTDIQTLSVDPSSPTTPVAVDSPLRFINSFSRVNVVRNKTLAQHFSSKFTGVIPDDPKWDRWVARGGSLDPPTLFIMNCAKTVGCTFWTTEPSHLTTHEECCSQELLDLKAWQTVACTHAGCGKTFAGLSEMKVHLKDQHATNRERCPECPDSAVKTYTKTALKIHMHRDHSGLWPTRCLVEDGCNQGQEYRIQRTYTNHLKKQHQLVTKESQQPYLPGPYQDARFRKGPCGIDGCTRHYDKPARLKRHISMKHKWSNKDATAYIKSRLTERPGTSVATPAIHGKRKLQAYQESDVDTDGGAIEVDSDDEDD